MSLGKDEEVEDRSGLGSQDFKTAEGFGFGFIGNGEPRKALDQKSVSFRTVLLSDFGAVE